MEDLNEPIWAQRLMSRDPLLCGSCGRYEAEVDREVDFEGELIRLHLCRSCAEPLKPDDVMEAS